MFGCSLTLLSPGQWRSVILYLVALCLLHLCNLAVNLDAFLFLFLVISLKMFPMSDLTSGSIFQFIFGHATSFLEPPGVFGLSPNRAEQR